MNRRIKIFSLNDKYVFNVDNFSSLHHSELTSFSQRYYRNAWEACRDARFIAKKCNYLVDSINKFAMEDLTRPVIEEVSSSIMIADHYEKIFDGLADEASGSIKLDDKKKEINYKEAKLVLGEVLFLIDKIKEDDIEEEEYKKESIKRLNNIKNKIKSLVHKYYQHQLNDDVKKSKEKENQQPMMENVPPPDMNQQPLAKSRSLLIKVASISFEETEIEEIFEEYAQLACKSLENKHRDLTYKILMKERQITLVSNKKDLLKINIENDYFVGSIEPGEEIVKLYPLCSIEFYQTYWKPVVEAIGHCGYGNGDDILYLNENSLPDYSPNGKYKVKLMSKKTKESKDSFLTFKGEDPTWLFEKTAQVNNQPKVNDLVICTVDSLPTYFQKTGEVIKLVKFSESEIEYIIDFGNSYIRMTTDQFKIVDVV